MISLPQILKWKQTTNNFFTSQCTPFDNSSKIPESQTYITNTKLSSIKFENKNIINIIRSLSVGKTHGHDNIFIRMLKICKRYSTAVWIKVRLLIFGKDRTSAQFTKKVTSK